MKKSTKKSASKKASKKVGKKRSATGSSRKKITVAARAKKAGKGMMRKVGLNKTAVKKKVVTKLKRVGTAMARAALDELMPDTEGRLPGEAVAKGGQSERGGKSNRPTSGRRSAKS